MAILRKPSDSLAPRERVPWSIVDSGRSEDLVGLTEEQRTTLRAIELDIATAAFGTEYDLRKLLRLTPAAAAVWEAERRTWILARLRDDPRVDFGDRHGDAG